MRQHEGHDPMIPSGAHMETQDEAFERRLKEGYERQKMSQNDVVGHLDADIDRLTLENEALKEAIRWVLEDAAYKAPEQIGDVARRWVTRLADALSPTQETDPE